LKTPSSVKITTLTHTLFSLILLIFLFTRYSSSPLSLTIRNLFFGLIVEMRYYFLGFLLCKFHFIV
jgi:VIT1/CCC1 family predicted Fe2+/Mn2+ transporter